jgi:regulator of protease activity HflC (stomatin/prohibitin superfamily)
MSDDKKIGCGVVGVVAAIALFVAILVVATHFKHVGPGTVGLDVNYAAKTDAGKPSITELSVGYHWQGLRHKIVSYSVAQQTLTMVQRVEEGKLKADDSVKCQDQNGVQLNIDSATYWRVKIPEAGDLFLLRPNVPLKSDGSSDIEDLVVRSDVRNAIASACSYFTYDGIYGADHNAFEQKVTEILGATLSGEHLQLDQFALREVHLQQQQIDAINRVADARQNVITSSLAKQQAENEAAGKVAAAEGDKQATIKAAEAQAESIRVIQEQLSKSPAYLAYLQVTKWDGRLPLYNLGDNQNVLLPLNPQQ